MMFAFEGASASAPIEATGSCRKSVSTPSPRPSFSTRPHHPPQNNRPRDFPARPPRRPPPRREMARSSAIASPNKVKVKFPVRLKDRWYTVQAKCQQQFERYALFGEALSSRARLNGGNSTIGQHLNSSNAQQPLVRRHESQIIYLRRRHQKPVRWIAISQHREPQFVRNFPAEGNFSQIQFLFRFPEPLAKISLELNSLFLEKDDRFPDAYRG